MGFHVQFTRYETKVAFCFQWMLGELHRREKKVDAMVEDLGDRIINGIRNRVEYQFTESDKRIDKEKFSLYTDIYAKFGIVFGVLNALKKWGRRSFRILELGTEIIEYVFDNATIDVRFHFIKSGGVLFYEQLQGYLMALSKSRDVERLMKMSEEIQNFAERA